MIFRPFPTAALPEPCRRFVDEAAKAIGCDHSYVAAPMLAALSGSEKVVPAAIEFERAAVHVDIGAALVEPQADTGPGEGAATDVHPLRSDGEQAHAVAAFRHLKTAVEQPEILRAFEHYDRVRPCFALAQDKVMDPAVHGSADDQQSCAPTVEDDGAKAFAMKRDIVLLQQERPVDHMETGLQADTAALRRQRVDRRLNVAARTNDEGAAALVARARRAAVAGHAAGRNGGQKAFI